MFKFSSLEKVAIYGVKSFFLPPGAVDSREYVYDRGPSINYVVSKSEVFYLLPPLSSFLLSRVYLVNRVRGYSPPPLPRRHSLWTPLVGRWVLY